MSEGMRKPGCPPYKHVAWMPSEAVQWHSFKQGATDAVINSALGFSEDRGRSDEATSFGLSPGTCWYDHFSLFTGIHLL